MQYTSSYLTKWPGVFPVSDQTAAANAKEILHVPSVTMGKPELLGSHNAAYHTIMTDWSSDLTAMLAEMTERGDNWTQ